MAEYCDDCGNHAVVRKAHYGQPLDECEFCGALYGDGNLIERIEDDREADGRGIDRGVFPLLRELDDIKGVRCFDSSEGDPAIKEPPYVNFHISGDRVLPILEALLTSLSVSNQLVQGRWHVEVLLHNGSAGFTLRPRRPPTEQQRMVWIELCQQDVEVLVKQLTAHRKLKWWRV